MPFRSRSDGSHYPVRGSLYGRKPKSQLYHRQIHFGDETEARASVRFADEKWSSYHTRQERVHLLKAVNEAANRAKAESENPRLSESEKRKASSSHVILRRWVEEHKGKE